MPPREWRIRVDDMLEAARRIEQYVAGLTAEQFASDPKTFDAVVRNLEVIGEAARRTPEDVRRTAPDIPWLDIADMRNILAHEYFGVDAAIVWKTAADDVPNLAGKLRKMLEMP